MSRSKKMRGKGMKFSGKSGGGETFPRKASGLAMKQKHSSGPSGESYPAGSLDAKPA